MENVNTTAFSEILMSKLVTPQNSQLVADLVTLFSVQSVQVKRELAVVSALELIRADVSSSFSHSGTVRKNSDLLNSHMVNLSKYADCILDAMKS